jgi:rod shape-determining protein MreD
VKYAVGFALVAAAALLQTSALPAFTVLGVHPNLVLVLILSWAMVRGLHEAMVIVPMGALTLGLMDGQPVGAALLAAMPIVLLTEIREARIVQGDFLLAVLLIILSTLAYEMIFLLTLRLTGGTADWWGSFAYIAVPSAIVNAFLMPPVYWLLWLGSRDLGRVRAI